MGLIKQHKGGAKKSDNTFCEDWADIPHGRSTVHPPSTIQENTPSQNWKLQNPPGMVADGGRGLF